MSEGLIAKYDEKLGGFAIKDDHGSYILFKDGNIFIEATKEAFIRGHLSDTVELKD
jgi:TfoX/Sxy family transcriptional regulator of competence genes